MTRYWFAFQSAYTDTRYNIDKEMRGPDAQQLYRVLASGFTNVTVRYLVQGDMPGSFEWRTLTLEDL